MLTSPNRLFSALVVGGTTLTLGCAAQADTAPKSSSPDLEPDIGPESESESEAEPEAEPAAEDLTAETFECAGEGVECSSNGVGCCWANHPGCESCCPDL